MLQNSQENDSSQISYKIKISHCYNQMPTKYDQYLSISISNTKASLHGKRMLYFPSRLQYYPTEFNLHFKRLSYVRKLKFKGIQRNLVCLFIHTSTYMGIYPAFIFVSICDIIRILPAFTEDKLLNVSSPYFTYLDDVEKFPFMPVFLP